MNAILRQRDALTTVIEGSPIFTATVPIALGSTANLREHHKAKAARVAKQRAIVGLVVRAEARARRFVVFGPVVVRLVRQSPRLLDDDNLAGALKTVRDSVADWLGVNDNNPHVSWVPDQAKAKTPSVLVEVYMFRGES